MMGINQLHLNRMIISYLPKRPSSERSPVKPLVPSRLSVVTGWGTLNATTNARPTALQHVFLQTMSNEDCKSNSNYNPDEISDSMLCARDEGLDACQGDSGGGLPCHLSSLINHLALPNSTHIAPSNPLRHAGQQEIVTTRK